MNKNRINHLKYLEPAISVIFWLLLFASPLLLGNSEDGIDWDRMTDTWISFVPYLFLFLLNRFVFLPYLFFRERRWLYFISNLALILIVAMGVHYYRVMMIDPRPIENQHESMTPPPGNPPAHHDNRPPPGTPPVHRDELPPPKPEGRPIPRPEKPPKPLPPFVSFVVVSVLIIGFDTGLVISVKWARSEQERIHLEKENVENQLGFLRNQVSPHFFMNTLNNIHSLIDINTEEAKKSIIKLSKLMRHLLYDSEVEQIPIRKELEFIRNYVDLMRLRYSKKVSIDLEISGQVAEKSIPPLLFTSFLENAFKHGISHRGNSFISIAFNFVEERLEFSIKNSNPHLLPENGHAGIGIENSRKRLDLLYADRYSLEIEDKDDEYTVSLILPI